MLARLQRKFEYDVNYHHAYETFLNEYQSLQHMARVTDDEEEPPNVFYLPHHGVVKTSSLTTKLRVVFNGSCVTEGGLALNNILHTGAKLQTNLFEVILYFRQHKYVFLTDVEKMYRQILVHPDDWKYQRILWKEKTSIITYQLTTVTYGLVCAPFLALRVMLQLIEDEGGKYPLAIKPLTEGRYVDDIFGGADTIDEAQRQTDEISRLCKAGGFPLKQWISNNPAVLELIPSEYHFASNSVPINDTVVHALGLSWNPSLDDFRFSFHLLPPLHQLNDSSYL